MKRWLKERRTSQCSCPLTMILFAFTAFCALQSSGWISDADPYGWFQWYCRFFQGRRCSDDARQISRWKGVAGAKGRFKSQLCNKILAKIGTGVSEATAVQDVSISPVIRQTLFHWGLQITEEVLEKHRKQKR